MDGRLHWFNASCEAEAARGVPGYTASREARALARDLEALPWVVAAPGDAVLVTEPPAPAWLATLVAAGITPPRFVTSPADVPEATPAPWGASPDAAKRLGSAWSEAARSLYRKDRWVPLLAALVAAGDPDVCGPIDVGRVETSVTGAIAAIAALRSERLDAVIKAPFGTSGRAAKRVLGDAVAPTRGEARWLEKVIAEQGAVVVEPWRDRTHDLSVLLDVSDAGARLLGATRFATDGRGQYLGTVVAAGGEAPVDRRWAPALARATDAVGAALHTAGHRGRAGFDAMIFVDEAGRPRLKPLLEVNPRTTMGHVALALSDRVAPGCHACWRLFGRRDVRVAGAAGFSGLVDLLAAEIPFERAPDGRLRSGVLATNDPARAEVVVGALMVSPAPLGRRWACASLPHAA